MPVPQIDYEQMKAKWPSSVVTRSRVAELTGGILAPGTMANLDSRGEGPPKVNIGRKSAYPLDQFIEWFKAYIRQRAVSVPKAIKRRKEA